MRLFTNVALQMVIPGGTAVVVQPTGSSRSYSWTANVAAGTDMIFMMADSRGRQGGASDIRTVGASDDSSCLNARSPSSTTARATTTSGSTSSHSQAASATVSDSTPAATSEAASGVPISAIAGTVIGSLLFLAVIVTLGLFFLKNLKKKSEKNSSDFEFKESRRPQSDGTFFDRRGHTSYGPYQATEGSYFPHSPNSAAPLDNPFADTREVGHPTPADSTSQFPYYQNDPFQRPYYPPAPQVAPRSQDPFNPGEPQPLSRAVSGPTAPPGTAPSEAGGSESRETSTTQQKAGMAGIASYKPTRFVVHTDAEDELPPPNEDGVVELPPQYTERRRKPSRTLSVMNPSPPSPTYPNTSSSNHP